MRTTVANWRTGGSPAGAQIIVQTPNGGQSWAAGSSQAIAWTYSGLSGTNLMIHLSDGTNTYYLGTVPVSWGGATWTVADAPGSSWRIKMCVVNESSPSQRSSTTSPSPHTCEASDASDAAFTITP
jgi:hypothetical protein